MEDLDEALKLDPRFFEARLLRSRVSLANDDPTAAISDLNVCFAQLHESDFRKAGIASELGGVYLSQFASEAAVRFTESAINLGDNSLDTLNSYARALYLDSRYDAALVQANKCLSIDDTDEIMRLLPSQLLAAKGDMEGALKSLQIEEKRLREDDDSSNLAEAYLAVSPARTKELLMGNRHVKDNIREMLTSLASLLLEEQLHETGLSRMEAKRDPGEVVEYNWDLTEIVAILKAKRFNGTISSEALQYASRIVKRGTGISLPPSLLDSDGFR